MPKLHTVVSGPVEVAESMFNSKFLAAWLLTPCVNGADHQDDFGLFIAGGEL